LAALVTEEAAPEARPDPAQVRCQFAELTSIIDQAPVRAREAAHRLLTEITLTPTIEDGEEVYAAVGGVKTNSAAHLGGRVLDKDGCGGAIGGSTKTAALPYRAIIRRLKQVAL
jgi:hypothetical protein